MAGTLTVQNLQGPSSGANANKIIVPAGQELAAAGHVVQVSHSTSSTQIIYGTGSTSWITAATGNFTPKFASSRVYVDVTLQYGNRTTGELQFDHRLLRGTTAVTENLNTTATGTYDVVRFPAYTSASAGHHFTTFQMVDDPATTTAITYNFQIARPATSYPDIHINFAGGRAKTMIKFMEIAQ